MLTAAVLYRLLRRKPGNTVAPFFDPATTRHTRTFWNETVKTLPLAEVDGVILCGITFDSRDPARCLAELAGLSSRTTEPLAIYSHRWPDGYESASHLTRVPPFDLLEDYVGDLDTTERQLLRLSLVISRQASAQHVSLSDIELAERLSDRIFADPKGAWDDLTCDPATLLARLAALPHSEVLPLHDARLEQESEDYAIFTFGPEASRRAEKTLERLLVCRCRPETAIGAAIVATPEGDTRVYLNRRWPRPLLPSLEYLLSMHGMDLRPELWLGRPDARHLRFSDAGLTTDSIPSFKDKLVTFLRAASKEQYGVSSPPTALSRVLHVAAQQILKELDVSSRLVLTADGDLQFQSKNAKVLIERGNRSGNTRLTFLMSLGVLSERGAAFLLSHDGYNLQKLETLLLGVLLGLGVRKSTWLDILQIPTRLRIDTDFAPSLVGSLGQVVGASAEVEVVPYSTAVECGLVRPESVIGKGLVQFYGRDTGRVLIYRGSETIGPSVPYALVASALAAAVGLHKGASVDVLDLFSGSGLSALAVLSRQSGWRVFCVDATVTREQAGLPGSPNVTWAHGDVFQCLSSIDSSFDLVCADPPHSVLFEILLQPRPPLGVPLLDRISSLGRWLLVYPGHLSQWGRAVALSRLTRPRFEALRLWSVGSELLIVAGPSTWHGASFEACLTTAGHLLRESIAEYGLQWRDHGDLM